MLKLNMEEKKLLDLIFSYTKDILEDTHAYSITNVEEILKRLEMLKNKIEKEIIIILNEEE